MLTISEQYYKFMGISNKKKKNKIFNILSYCKEIRDTAYPMKDSKVTELEIVEFTARKENDLIYINGSLSLVDGNERENRTFEAYIIEEKEEGNIRVYLDVTRLCVDDEPKMIRTSEAMVDAGDNILDVIVYATTDSVEEKTFTQEFPKREESDYYYLRKKTHQISAM